MHFLLKILVVCGHFFNKTVEAIFLSGEVCNHMISCSQYNFEKATLSKFMRLFNIIDENGFPGKILNYPTS